LNRPTAYVMTGGLLVALAACQTPPVGPTPANVPVQNPPTSPPAVYPADIPKPLPQQDTESEPPPPAFGDPPLVDQRLPEEAWFVGTYNHVGRPRIAVFVNRTLAGSLMGEYDNSTPGYLQPGQYDDASLATLDYEEMESLLQDWFSCDGQVTLISPDFIRSHMTDQDVAALQAGKASGLDALSKSTQADVLVQVQAHPVRRNDQVVVLLVAEAINIRGGESLAHASVEMPTPIDRYTLNNYTRFLTRKVIHELTNAWNAPVPTTQPQQ
jgi:hypothetical protein